MARASASDRIAACAQDRYGMTLPDTRYECRSPRSADLTRRRSGGAGLRPRDGHQRLAARKLQSCARPRDARSCAIAALIRYTALNPKSDRTVRGAALCRSLCC